MPSAYQLANALEDLIIAHDIESQNLDYIFSDRSEYFRDKLEKAKALVKAYKGWCENENT